MDENFGGLIIFAILGAAIYGGYQLVEKGFQPHTEVSGVVDYSDCREQITLYQYDFTKKSGTFVCNDEKTNSGKSMGGQCIQVQMDSTGKCQTAYVYNKPADETCSANSYLTVDDKCSCDYGYVMDNGVCTDINKSCSEEYGSNSYGLGTMCYCSSGYIWNSAKTYCISSYGAYY